MLGELYKPKGLALETAKAVLEVEEPYACNVAWGCSNGCLYCYGPKAGRQSREDWLKVRLPKKPPIDLVRHQLEDDYKFHAFRYRSDVGVFLSFLTEPFLPQIKNSTSDLIALLLAEKIKVATLSKLGNPYQRGIRKGMTIVSLSQDFSSLWEPKALLPHNRINTLRFWKHEFDDYVWISMEPYPPSSIHKQNLTNLLNELNFVDLIVYGMWNYDARARTEEARREYAENIQTLIDFCKSNNIRLHIKSDTLRFVKTM